MLKSLLRDFKLLFLVLLAILVKAFSVHALLVEQYYTYGAYPVIAKVMRTLFGWLPFSFGDLLYAGAGLYLVYLVSRLIWAFKQNGFTRNVAAAAFSKLVKVGLIVYLAFNVLWGLNYSRQGIAYQLQLQVQPYTLQDVHALTERLQQQLNFYAAQVDTVRRSTLDNDQRLFDGGIAVYQAAQQQWPYLAYSPASIKPSLYTVVGHYFGFTGYYNPFSGEAQLKTTIPAFIKPFVTTHEIAHQLGYAKENEANFVAFLASKHSGDVDFLYSLYYELYRYALREVYNRDSTLALTFKEKLHPRVRMDNELLKQYLQTTVNKVEPFMSAFYDQFLKLNNQEKGVQTYNEVVALLVAYGKKYGLQSI